VPLFERHAGIVTPTHTGKIIFLELRVSNLMPRRSGRRHELRDSLDVCYDGNLGACGRRLVDLRPHFDSPVEFFKPRRRPDHDSDGDNWIRRDLESYSGILLCRGLRFDATSRTDSTLKTSRSEAARDQVRRRGDLPEIIFADAS
jgi:hypothetical protein